jgi:small subunit ribosomal protein S2
MYYVNQRWLGGILTNFTTIQARIDHLVHFEDQKTRGGFNHLPKKEVLKIDEEISRLNKQMGGFKEMTSLPRAIFIADPLKDRIALAEAKKMEIPVIAIVDTNCDPERIEYPIPANDDAIKAIKLICGKLADAAIEGQQLRISELPEEQETPSEPEESVEILRSYTFEPEGE